VMSIRENLITSLPAEFSQLSSLRVMDIACNRLEYLPAAFVDLNLSALWLSDNQSKPLVPLQSETQDDSGEQVLINYLLPQQGLDTTSLDQVGNMPETESEEEDTSEAVKHNNRESKIFFDVKTEKEEAPLPRHPTPHPKQLKEMKAKHMSWNTQQGNAAGAVPTRPAPEPPVNNGNTEEDAPDSPGSSTSPLLNNNGDVVTNNGDKSPITTYQNPLKTAEVKLGLTSETKYERLDDSNINSITATAL